MSQQAEDPFRAFLAELSDGKRWTLLRSDGWDEFTERLSTIIVELPPRRRQALVMLLFALSERMLTPDDANAWIVSHDLEGEEGVELMIKWLRTFQPPSP